MKYLTLFITVPVTVFAVLLVVSNTANVPLHMLPGDEPLQLPLYMVALPALVGGFFLGALFVSIHSQKTFFGYLREKARAEKLEKELDVLNKKQAEEADSREAAVMADRRRLGHG